MRNLGKFKLIDLFKSVSTFRIFFVFNLFLQSFIFLDAACCTLDVLLLVWSLYFLRKIILVNIKNPEFMCKKLIASFIASSLITAVLHININFPRNILFEILMILYYCVCFFIFLSSYIDMSKESFSRETTTIFKLISFFNTGFILASFILILIKRQIVFSGSFFNNPPFRYIAGIYTVTNAQRFTGLYENPNIAAFCSVISLIFLHMLLVKKEFFSKLDKWSRRALFLMFASINMLALMLSDSISSFLFLTVYAILVLFNRYVSFKYPDAKQKIKNFLIFAFNTFVVVCVLMFVRQSIQESASSIISNISLNPVASSELLTDVNFGRRAYSIGDGNGRLELWVQAIEMFRRNPIFGIGTANINHYGKLYFGSEYNVQFPNFHNGYISILTCYGAVGTLIFAALIGIIMFSLLKVLLKNVSVHYLGIYPHIVASVVAYFVYALSEKTIFSEINIMGMFIWLILGYALTFKKIYLNAEES